MRMRFRRRTRAVVVQLTAEELAEQQELWRRDNAQIRDVIAPEEFGPYSCPCCGHRTLPERGSYDLCRECDWEDDGQDDHDSHVVRRGPNGGVSLDDARRRYVQQGGQPLPHSPPTEPK